jgi:hypothetical protein
MKYVYKRSSTDYVIGLEADGSGGGYNVVPKSVDPYNAYEIADVKAYLAANPDKLLDMPTIETETAIANEIVSLKAYLLSTDYIYPKCAELGIDVATVYANTITKRKMTRARIQELEATNG